MKVSVRVVEIAELFKLFLIHVNVASLGCGFQLLEVLQIESVIRFRSLGFRQALSKQQAENERKQHGTCRAY